MAQRLAKLAFSYIGFAIAVLISFVYAFVEISSELRERELDHFDSAVIGVIQGFVSPKLTETMLLITTLGSITFLTAAVLVTMIVSFSKRLWRTGLFIGLSSGAGALFNLFLKGLFKRERPDIQPLISELGYSFPSGHSMGSFIFYGAAAFLVFHYGQSRKAKIVGAISLLLVIFLVGISRIYLGVHYPSDIAAGFSAGGAWLTICITLFLYYEKKKKLESKKTAAANPREKRLKARGEV